jgi:8-amino-3,8-dideoxy-alpha-D-manno-octulosonate transaminase
VDRRVFIGSLGAAAAPASAASWLAVDGGAPVRKTPIRGENWGTSFYDEAERSQVIEVVDSHKPFRFSGRGGDPPMKAATFERELAALMGTRFALGVTSGTGALECAVAALGIGPGDEVILPAWTWHSDATAVIRAGALPVFAEIDESFNIDPADIPRRITPQTKAIIAVHLQGNPADMDPVLAIARKHKLRVIEDCCQSVGASYKGRRLGSLGDIGVYSHQLSKTITAGEGGSLVTSDPALFERACRFHDVGNLARPHQGQLGDARLRPFTGTNFRMSEFTGGVMLAQLRKLERIISSVRANSAIVYEGIRDLPGIRLRKRPDPAGGFGSPVFIEFAAKEQKERFVAAMEAENVGARAPGGSVILPIAPYIENKIATHPAWPTWTSPRGKAIRYGAASCPRTIDILSRFAGPSVGPKYSRQDLDDIIAAVRKVYPMVVRA